jgi:hypothetical protein
MYIYIRYCLTIRVSYPVESGYLLSSNDWCFTLQKREDTLRTFVLLMGRHASGLNCLTCCIGCPWLPMQVLKCGVLAESNAAAGQLASIWPVVLSRKSITSQFIIVIVQNFRMFQIQRRFTNQDAARRCFCQVNVPCEERFIRIAGFWGVIISMSKCLWNQPQAKMTSLCRTE